MTLAIVFSAGVLFSGGIVHLLGHSHLEEVSHQEVTTEEADHDDHDHRMLNSDSDDKFIGT